MFSDDEPMPLICPTAQVPLEKFATARRDRHCEERSDEAIQLSSAVAWIASRSLSSGAHSRDPLARNDGAAYGATGLAGWAGFGPGATGSIAGFGAVGVTVAPTAFAAALVVP